MDRRKISIDGLMSNREIERGLRLLMSPEGNREFGCMARLAALCGISRQDLYAIKDGQLSIPDQARAQLTEYLPRLLRGEVRFRRTSTTTGNQVWRAPEKVKVTWEVEYLEPPPVRPPPQPRLVPEADWRRWARCASCGGQVFSGFTGLAGKRWMACDGCVSAADRRMLGASR